MNINLSHILQGVRNNYFPPEELKETIRQVQAWRLDKCRDCPFNTTPGEITSLSKCSACGCFLKLKTACMDCACGIEEHNRRNPADQLELKWAAVATEAEDAEIKKIVDETGT